MFHDEILRQALEGYLIECEERIAAGYGRDYQEYRELWGFRRDTAEELLMKLVRGELVAA